MAKGRTFTSEEYDNFMKELFRRREESENYYSDRGGVVSHGKLGFIENFKELKEHERKMKEIFDNYVEDEKMLLEGLEKLEEERDAVTQRIQNIGTQPFPHTEKELIKQNELLDALEKKKDEIEEKINYFNYLSNPDNKKEFDKRMSNAYADYLKAKHQIRVEEEKITKELEKQSVEEERGLTFEERREQFLRNRLDGYDRIKTGINDITQGVRNFIGATMKFLDPWTKLDQASAQFARNIGLSAKNYEQFRHQVITTNAQDRISAITTISGEEQIADIESYLSNIGRNTGISRDQQFNLAASHFLLGKEQALGYTQALENFGISLNEATGRATELFKASTNTGVAMAKASKMFLDNIKYAQTFTFREGVEGLSKMALRAAEIKISFNDVARFAEKISTLEGSMQAAAGLSVLGGNFAMNANPLQMLYSGLNDFEGVSKMMENMLEGLVKYNAATKQLEMSAFDRQRLRQASQIMGVNYDTMVEQAFAKGREARVAPIIQNLGFARDSEEYRMLVNRSYLENGKAKVTVNGQARDVSSLTPEDIDLLKKNNYDDSENIRTIVSTLRGWDDVMRGTKEGIRAQMANNAEVSGVGPAAKGILKVANDHTRLLGNIYSAILGVNATIAAVGIGTGVANTIGGFRAGGATGIGSAWRAGVNIPSKAKWGMAGTGAALAIGGGLMMGHAFGNLDNGSDSASDRNMAIGGSVLSGMGTGAMMGSYFGLPGMAVGAAIGGAIAGGFGTYQANKKRLRNIAANNGIVLSDDYSNNEIRSVLGGWGKIQGKPSLIKKLNNDGYPLEAIKNFQRVEGFKQGGFVIGRGTETSDSNIALLSNKEYVMPAKEATKPFNAKVLEMMRSGNDLSSSIKPIGNTMKIIKINNTDKQSNSAMSNPDQYNISPKPIRIEPIDITGTIKLELGGSARSVDSKELLNNPIFVKNLTDMIAKNLNRQYNFGYDKNEYYKKF